MSDNNFFYCYGIGCPLSNICVRFVEGIKLPEGNWWWQYDCGSDLSGFLPANPADEETSVPSPIRSISREESLKGYRPGEFVESLLKKS